jgi:hypothetical protein
MTPKDDNRDRLTLTLSPAVATILDDLANVLGNNKTAIVIEALNLALPQLIERADLVRKRARELQQAAAQAGQQRKK